ncbi:hypothetical protein Glove_303g57 [Diversispora epigaea]|uniref:Uncharacterized protein n=1 Tax=Diversispora epigaea TaxID=1348612 RepID=A0A397I100_9GLOM|nr:hypothetical protein Glove_303g57 [Diversispora epigaea]
MENPAFMSSVSCSEQSKEIYISNIIIPLLRLSLRDLLNGNICLSTVECQSLANRWYYHSIPRYFHLDHAEIPLLPHASHTKALIHLLLTLRNIIIVNKSLLLRALEQANTHSPRNVDPSLTVSSPPYNN